MQTKVRHVLLFCAVLLRSLRLVYQVLHVHAIKIITKSMMTPCIACIFTDLFILIVVFVHNALLFAVAMIVLLVQKVFAVFAWLVLFVKIAFLSFAIPFLLPCNILPVELAISLLRVWFGCFTQRIFAEHWKDWLPCWGIAWLLPSKLISIRKKMMKVSERRNKEREIIMQLLQPFHYYSHAKLLKHKFNNNSFWLSSCVTIIWILTTIQLCWGAHVSLLW